MNMCYDRYKAPKWGLFYHIEEVIYEEIHRIFNTR